MDASTINMDELRDIFLKRRKNWDNNTKAIPINAPKGTELRLDFSERMLKMSDVQEGRYWQEQKIRSGNSPPAEFPVPLKAVFKLRGSVGYVYRADYREGVVNILLVLPVSE